MTIHQTVMLDALEVAGSQVAIKLYDKIAAGHSKLLAAEGRLLRRALTGYLGRLARLDTYEMHQDEVDAIDDLLRHLPE